MTPLPHNNTNIYYVDYSFRGNSHTMQFRIEDGATAADAADIAGQFLQSIGPALDPTWAVTGARWQARGTSFSLPVGFGMTIPVGSTEVAQVNYPRFFSFVGRGLSSGRRTRIFVYGSWYATPPDYRLTGTERAAFANGLGVLANEGGGVIVSVAGDPVRFNTYINAGYNSYYERKQRG